MVDMFYESPYGSPPIIGRHFRSANYDGTPRCGPHQHIPCTPAGCEPAHWDTTNPDCRGEFIPHLTQDWWPSLTPPKKAVVVGVAAVGLAYLAAKIFG